LPFILCTMALLYIVRAWESPMTWNLLGILVQSSWLSYLRPLCLQMQLSGWKPYLSVKLNGNWGLSLSGDFGRNAPRKVDFRSVEHFGMLSPKANEIERTSSCERGFCLIYSMHWGAHWGNFIGRRSCFESCRGYPVPASWNTVFFYKRLVSIFIPPEGAKYLRSIVIPHKFAIELLSHFHHFVMRRWMYIYNHLCILALRKRTFPCPPSSE